MKHDTNELILAAHVRALAQEKRQVAFQAAAGQVAAQYPDVAIDKSLTREERQSQFEADMDNADRRREAVAALKRDWHAAHPLQEFVPTAMAELENIAAFIRGHQAS